jgi:hypothetical protein
MNSNYTKTSKKSKNLKVKGEGKRVMKRDRGVGILEWVWKGGDGILGLKGLLRGFEVF